MKIQNMNIVPSMVDPSMVVPSMVALTYFSNSKSIKQ